MTEYFFSAPSTRELSNTRVVSYSPATAFAALADISAYERATSLIYKSSIATKDTNGLPKSAKLSVGYPALSLNEEWLSSVKCDRAKKTVELTNNADFQSSVVETYMMRWSVSPVKNDKTQAEIQLDLSIKFRGFVADSMFAVLPDVAASIMDRFVRLVEAKDKKDREEAKKKKLITEKKAVPSAKTPAVAKPAPVVKASEVAAATVKRTPKKLEVRGAQGSGGKQPAAT